MQTSKYILSGIYNNPGDATSGVSCAIRSVYVDGKDIGSLIFPEVYSDKKNQTGTHLTLNLEAGAHTVKVFYDTANWYDRNMSITKNDVEYNYFNLDYVGADEQPPTEPPTQATEPPTDPPTEPPTTPPTSQAVEIICGDVDGDGVVTVLDATAIQRYLALLPNQNGFIIDAADTDGAEGVTILDATEIQRYLASLPANEKIGTVILTIW